MMEDGLYCPLCLKLGYSQKMYTPRSLRLHLAIQHVLQGRTNQQWREYLIKLAVERRNGNGKENHDRLRL